ncbi:MAG: hypothetical protein ACHQ7M_20515, partial [Chloroflexota bacterium]
MKLVVYGPERRVGVLDGTHIVDVHGAFAKLAHEKDDEPLPYQLASAMAPAHLLHFIQAGKRAIDNAHRAVEHVSKAGDRGVEGEQLVTAAGDTRIHAPMAHSGIRLLMAAGNYADHAMGINANRRHKTIT